MNHASAAGPVMRMVMDDVLSGLLRSGALSTAEVEALEERWMANMLPEHRYGGAPDSGDSARPAGFGELLCHLDGKLPQVLPPPVKFPLLVSTKAFYGPDAELASIAAEQVLGAPREEGLDKAPQPNLTAEYVIAADGKQADSEMIAAASLALTQAWDPVAHNTLTNQDDANQRGDAESEESFSGGSESDDSDYGEEERRVREQRRAHHRQRILERSMRNAADKDDTVEITCTPLPTVGDLLKVYKALGDENFFCGSMTAFDKDDDMSNPWKIRMKSVFARLHGKQYFVPHAQVLLRQSST